MNSRMAATASSSLASATSEIGTASPSNTLGGFVLWELRSTTTTCSSPLRQIEGDAKEARNQDREAAQVRGLRCWRSCPPNRTSARRQEIEPGDERCVEQPVRHDRPGQIVRAQTYEREDESAGEQSRDGETRGQNDLPRAREIGQG